MNTNIQPGGRYLVTGGAGFIGSHICEELIERGCDVTAVDNFLTGRRENIAALLGQAHFHLWEHDIIEPLTIDAGWAGIFHLASPASPVDYGKYPIETLRVGSIGSDNVLKLALREKCPILVASTSEVYGDPLQHPQRETYWGNVNPIGPRGCYDESKRYLEALTMAYHRVYGLKTRIVRIFNTYGPRMRTDDGRVVPNLFGQALDHRPFTIYGDGKQTRSFCYVDDLVEGLIRAFLSDSSEPFNIGNPLELTILEFATRIQKICGEKSEIQFCSLPQDDPKVRNPDISRARKVLGWEPRVSLEDGLRRTYEYFQRERGRIAP